jgi:hypothetical protein
MGLLSPILRNAEGGRLIWWCPGCNSAHAIAVGDGAGPRWTWDGDAARPTFSPSVLVTYDGADVGRAGAPPAVCHSFVVDGAMQFLGDCTHALAGQTVPIPPWSQTESAS